MELRPVLKNEALDDDPLGIPGRLERDRVDSLGQKNVADELRLRWPLGPCAEAVPVKGTVVIVKLHRQWLPVDLVGRDEADPPFAARDDAREAPRPLLLFEEAPGFLVPAKDIENDPARLALREDHQKDATPVSSSSYSSPGGASSSSDGVSIGVNVTPVFGSIICGRCDADCARWSGADGTGP